MSVTIIQRAETAYFNFQPGSGCEYPTIKKIDRIFYQMTTAADEGNPVTASQYAERIITLCLLWGNYGMEACT